MVFEYYINFYKQVFTEEDYEKNRLQVYRFLVDAASDGIVPLSILPGAKKLGEERSKAVADMVEVDGVLMDLYRSRKLMDYYLEPVAIRNELELQDVRVLLGLKQINSAEKTEGLADSVGMPIRLYSAILQKLLQKNLIKIKRTRKPKQTINSLLPSTDSILKELAEAENNYEQARFADFSEEEIIQYKYLSQKMKNSMQKIL